MWTKLSPKWKVEMHSHRFELHLHLNGYIVSLPSLVVEVGVVTHLKTFSETFHFFMLKRYFDTDVYNNNEKNPFANHF